MNTYWYVQGGRFYVTTTSFSVSNLNLFPLSVGPEFNQSSLDIHGLIICYSKLGYTRKGRLMTLHELPDRND